MLHQHTIPSFIPLEELCNEFLGHGVAGLERFTLTLHRHLILLSNRTAIVTRLKALKGIEEVRADQAVRLVEFTTSKWTAKIMLLDNNERCLVMNNTTHERIKAMEEKILEREGKTDLVDRIARIL